MPILFAEASVSPSKPPVRPRSGIEWLAYFRENVDNLRPLPWDRGAEITADELAAIAPSLQGWQLGETSDGRHLQAAAVRYAERIGDPEYVAAVEAFIAEEQRHGETLGRFLDLAGAGRKAADWGDTLFRAARYFLRNIEVWTTPVIMVETLATVYYNAIRRASRSALLTEICRQILADEVPHLRFQCERLACIYRHRLRLMLRVTWLLQRLGFLLVVALVWAGHRRALRAGGYTWRRYWRAAWDRMNACWKAMDPRRYEWGREL